MVGDIMIRTAKEFRAEHGFKNTDNMNAAFAHKSGGKVKHGDARGKPVKARIDHERLIADCECNGAEYVDPDDLRFFCHSCGNKSNDGYYRPVTLSAAVKKELK